MKETVLIVILSNSLRLIPNGELPRAHIVGPKLDIMEKALDDLDVVVLKLACLCRNFNLHETDILHRENSSRR